MKLPVFRSGKWLLASVVKYNSCHYRRLCWDFYTQVFFSQYVYNYIAINPTKFTSIKKENSEKISDIARWDWLLFIWAIATIDKVIVFILGAMQSNRWEYNFLDSFLLYFVGNSHMWSKLFEGPILLECVSKFRLFLYAFISLFLCINKFYIGILRMELNHQAGFVRGVCLILFESIQKRTKSFPSLYSAKIFTVFLSWH